MSPKILSFKGEYMRNCIKLKVFELQLVCICSLRPDKFNFGESCGRGQSPTT